MTRLTKLAREAACEVTSERANANAEGTLEMALLMEVITGDEFSILHRLTECARFHRAIELIYRLPVYHRDNVARTAEQYPQQRGASA